MRKLFVAVFSLVAAGFSPAFAETPATVTMGVINIQAATPIYLAVEKGYFKDAGVNVVIEPIESTGGAMPLLASGKLQLVVGGLNASYWNALGKYLPVILAFGTASSPVYTVLMIRPDLAGTIKTAADFKGRSIASNAPGVTSVYQLAKLLESANLTLKDADVRYIPLTQMGIALNNHAIDAALMSPPFSDRALDQKIAVKWIDFDDFVKPQPTVLGAFTANSDWTKQSRDQAKRVFLAVGRGSRDYCQAYHHGPNRGEVEDVMVKYKLARDRESVDGIAWQSRDPNGGLSAASLEDIQDVFFKEHLIEQKFPVKRIVDESFAADVAKELGPFEVVNKDSKDMGCR